MSILKQLWQIWRSGDLDFCLKLFRRYKKECQEASEINAKMKTLGFLDSEIDAMVEHLPPALHVGTAIKFANHYGLSFNIGTTHYDCRAILPRSRWQRDINRDVPLEMLALFTVPQSHDEIKDFQGISDRIEIAICKCLIKARIAGVI